MTLQVDWWIMGFFFRHIRLLGRMLFWRENGTVANIEKNRRGAEEQWPADFSSKALSLGLPRKIHLAVRIRQKIESLPLAGDATKRAATTAVATNRCDIDETLVK